MVNLQSNKRYQNEKTVFFAFIQTNFSCASELSTIQPSINPVDDALHDKSDRFHLRQTAH